FFAIAADLREPRSIDVKLQDGRTESDNAWLMTMPPVGRADLKSELQRLGSDGSSVPGLGRDYATLWVAVFNPDPGSEKKYEPTVLILPPEFLDVLVQPFSLLLRRADALTRLVVGREQLGQKAEDLTGLLDPLRDSLSGFSSGCGVHDHPRLLRGALRLHSSMAERSTGTYRPCSCKSVSFEL